MNDLIDPAGGGVVSKAECARALGVSKAYITKETKPGGKLSESVTEDGRIDMTTAAALIRSRRDASKASAGATVHTITEDDRRLKRAKVRKAEADADAADAARQAQLGVLVDRAAYDRQVFTRIRTLRDLLMAIPGDVSDELAAKTDPREIKGLLSGRLRVLLDDFVDQTKAARHA